MSLYQLFLTSFKEPRKLILGSNKKFGKIFLYLVFLAILMTIPIGIQISKVIQGAQKDLLTISERIPDFSITDNKLTAPDSKGFIQQTDNFIFTFDPKGVYQPKDVQDDLIGNAVGLALLEKEAVLTVPTDHLMANMLPQSLLTIKYDKLDTKHLNKEWITHQIDDNTQTRLVRLLAYLFAFLPMFINFVISILMLSLIGNVWCKMSGSLLSLGQSFKIMTFAATTPVVLTTVLALIHPGVDQMFIIMFLTFLIYLRIIRPTFIRPKLK